MSIRNPRFSVVAEVLRLRPGTARLGHDGAFQWLLVIVSPSVNLFYHCQTVSIQDHHAIMIKHKSHNHQTILVEPSIINDVGFQQPSTIISHYSYPLPTVTNKDKPYWTVKPLRSTIIKPSIRHRSKPLASRRHCSSNLHRRLWVRSHQWPLVVPNKDC